jgi:hypothetical protein
MINHGDSIEFSIPSVTLRGKQRLCYCTKAKLSSVYFILSRMLLPALVHIGCL